MKLLVAICVAAAAVAARLNLAEDTNQTLLNLLADNRALW